MVKQNFEFGIHGMNSIINGTKNFDGVSFFDEKKKKEYLLIEKENRKSKIRNWVKSASEVIDRELIEKYKEMLTDFVLNGPGNGELMDKSMAVLMALRDFNMEAATDILCTTDKEMDRFFIQNMAFLYSDLGPEFVIFTLKRDLTAEENLKFSLKRMEIERRKNSRIERELFDKVGNQI